MPGGQAEQVRRHLYLLAGKHGPGPSESDSNLVRNHQHVVPAGQFSDTSQVTVRVHDHASGTLNERLQDHGSGLVVMFLQDFFQLGKVMLAGVLAGNTHWQVITIRDGHLDGLKQQGLEHLVESGNAPDTDAAKRVAVVSSTQCDEQVFVRLGIVALPPVLEGHLQSDLYRGGAVPGKKHVFKPFGGKLDQASGQFLCRRV